MKASFEPTSANVPGELLLAPSVIASAVLLGLNDHYLKANYPSWFTGKLSDFAGLVVLPCVICSIWEWASYTGFGVRRALGGRFAPVALTTNLARKSQGWLISTRVVSWTILLTALGFAAIKLSPSASELYCAVVSTFGGFLRGTPLALGTPRNVVDSTDLIALPALFVPFMLARKRQANVRRSTLELEGTR